MTTDWSPLQTELAIWRRENLPLTVWWRDDDAVAATPELAQLSAVSQDTGLPVYVAVIPHLVEDSLLPAIASAPHLIPVIHGWQHVSHAPIGAKNSEFGHPRDSAKAELTSALMRMQEVFGRELVPMFVPPWNRIDQGMLPVLEKLGYGAVSIYGPRPLDAKLLHINTHIDPIFWRGDRGLVEPEVLIAQIVHTLRQRRFGATDPTEPLGLLTHHLDHTGEIWRFVRDVVIELLDGGATSADITALVQAGRSPSI